MSAGSTDDDRSNNNNDYYAILGVAPTADDKTIRKAYLKLSLQCHPDKNPENPAAAKEAFVRIGQAYGVLSDPQQRAAYDRYRTTASATSSSSFSDFEQQQQSSSYQYASQPQTYETYREAFDATMAGLNEDELRDVMGAAALIAGVVGSLVGSRVLGGGGQNNRLLRNVGSMVGSLVASEAASSLVQTVHEQSRERATLDQDRRERLARGETDVPTPKTAQEAWQDLVETAASSVKQTAKKISTATAARRHSHQR